MATWGQRNRAALRTRVIEQSIGVCAPRMRGDPAHHRRKFVSSANPVWLREVGLCLTGALRIGKGWLMEGKPQVSHLCL